MMALQEASTGLALDGAEEGRVCLCACDVCLLASTG